MGLPCWRRWSLAPPAAADLAQEEQLAARFAPVVRLVEQVEECGPGEPYQPLDVDALFEEPTVALRGPWGSGDLVRIGPADTDLGPGLYEYHLDFPGDALSPGCTYEQWARRISEGRQPTVYAHVVSDPGYPGQLALQYWLFYAFNDWNNLHEGDWEMIQLVFDVGTAGEALTALPREAGYSQHEGGERSDWTDGSLEVVDGTHPVVYPAAGSHANFFGSALHLGASGSQGVGCDDTTGPSLELRPQVLTIPSDPTAGQAAYPWLDFEGRWGELQPAFYNGPTGPNLKTQWTQPILWSQDWRDTSYAVPAGGALGTGATDFFCDAIAKGSRALGRAVDDPGWALVCSAPSWRSWSGCWPARPGRPARRCISRDAAAGGRCSPPRAAPTSLAGAVRRDRRRARPGVGGGGAAADAAPALLDLRRRRQRVREQGLPGADRGCAGDDADAARARRRAGGHGPRPARARRRSQHRPGARLPPGVRPAAAAARRTAGGGARGHGADRHDLPDPGRDLADRALGADRAGHRVRGRHRARRAPSQRSAGAPRLVEGGVADRRRSRLSRWRRGRSSGSC